MQPTDYAEVLVPDSGAGDRARASAAARSKLIVAMSFCFVFMIAECVIHTA